jgi:hypothetical protein
MVEASNASLAAQAVAMGPATTWQPSFNGHDWLVALNLAVFTGGAIIGAMGFTEQVKRIWINRRRDFRGHPATIWRVIGLLVFAAMALRCGAAAAVLWKWNAADPAGTGWVLTMQRFVDPVALSMGITAVLLFTLSSPGMIEQLRREPLPVRMWVSLPMLRRPLLILILSAAAAIGVVATR